MRSRPDLLAGWVLVLLAAPLLLSPGCDDGAGVCEPGAEKSTVVELMAAYYLYNDEAGQREKYGLIDVDLYGTFEAMLDYLRWGYDQQNGWSYVTTVAEDEAFLSGGPFTSFGFLYDVPGDDSMTVQLAFVGGPAYVAGIERGDAVLAIEGQSIASLGTRERIAEALGYQRPGTTRTLSVQKPGEAAQDIVLTTAAIPLPTISPRPPSYTSPVTLSSSVGDVGYLPFILFLETAVGQLDQVFGAFKSAGVRNIVVDLRYSPGGLVRVASHFSSLLGGPANAGKLQKIVRHNSDIARDADYAEYFQALPNAIDLDRIAFITTGDTASAAESLINELDVAFTGIDVGVVGAPSLGKAAGQVGIDFCADQLRFRMIAFEIHNGEDEGGYYDGLDVDCGAIDDLSRPLGDPQEDSLATALHWLQTGLCPTEPAGLAAPAAEAPHRPTWYPGEAWRRPLSAE